MKKVYIFCLLIYLISILKYTDCVYAEEVKSFTSLEGLQLLDVTFSKELRLFVLVGNDSMSGKIFVSADGLSWTLRKSDAPKFTAAPALTEANRPLYRQKNVIWSKSAGKFIALAGTLFITSEDGWKWTTENVTGGYNFDYIYADDYRIVATQFSSSTSGGDGKTHVYRSIDLKTWSELGTGVGGRRFCITNNAENNPLYFYFRRYTNTSTQWWTMYEHDSDWVQNSNSGGSDPGFGDIIYSRAKDEFIAAYDKQYADTAYKGVARISTAGVLNSTYITATGDTGSTAIATSGSKIVIGCLSGNLFIAADSTGALSFTEVVPSAQSETNLTTISSIAASPDNIFVAVAGQQLLRIADEGNGYRYAKVQQYKIPDIEVSSFQYMNENSTIISTLAGQKNVKVCTGIKSNASSQQVAFVGALYDMNGKLKYVATDIRTIANPSLQSFTVNVFDNGHDLNGYKLKVFIWENTENLKPLSNVSVFSQSSQNDGDNYHEFYVSNAGDDIGGDGTLEKPWKTIQKVADMMAPGDTCIIRGGTYRETVRPRLSGESGKPLKFQAYPGEAVTVSGADIITGWVNDSGSIYKTDMNWTLGSQNQIFVNGQMQLEARWPNSVTLDPLNPVFNSVDTGSATSINDIDITQPDGYWTGKTLWCVPGTGYRAYSSTITGSTVGGITFNKISVAPTAGNKYYITGNLQELDSEGEWYVDSSTGKLYLWAKGGSNPCTMTVEAKKRIYAFDLSARSYIEVSGINIFAATINMADANYCKISDINAQYLSHDTNMSNQYNTGIFMTGSNNELRDSTLAYSSGCLVRLQGQDNKVINNLIHEADYSAADLPAVYLLGSRHLISHNTIYNSGRFLIFMPTQNSRIQYNNLYYAGKLTRDCGGIYAFGWDGKGTAVHHNYVHETLSTNYSSNGIYLDNGCKGYIVHHNVVWGNYTGIRLNTPSNFNLIYNNTVYNNGNIGYWGSGFVGDMYGDRIFNNIFTSAFTLPGIETQGNNINSGTDPKFINVPANDFTLQPNSPAIDAGMVIVGITDGYNGSAPDIGAYEYGGGKWTAGHDFTTLPQPVFENMSILYDNLVSEAGFEGGFGSAWTKTYSAAASVVDSSITAPRSCYKSARLGTGEDGIQQTLTGLSPDTHYVYTAWAKVDLGEQVKIGVTNFGGADSAAAVGDSTWTMINIPFTTGPNATGATIYAYKPAGSGCAYIDDFGVVERD